MDDFAHPIDLLVVALLCVDVILSSDGLLLQVVVVGTSRLLMGRGEEDVVGERNQFCSWAGKEIQMKFSIGDRI